MKLGKFKISDTIIHDARMDNKHLSRECLGVLFGIALPIHIENRPHKRDHIYTCVSDKFKNIKEGESIPFYEATFVRDKNNNIKIKGIKAD